GRRAARAAMPLWDAGLTVGWHNHDFEVVPCADGSFPLDHIMDADPRMTLELDIAWVQIGGQDPFAWVEKYNDRLVAAHLKDIAPKGMAEDEDGWADLGQGVMDWAGLMKLLQKGSARYFIMEHDNPSDHVRFAERSLMAANTFAGGA
ncbi:MAG: sugar phosphate isomerase/epimerase, partial [Pseudomonadota bacterium]